MFTTFPVAVPAALLLFLMLGLLFPLYDYLHARRIARHEGRLAPGLSFLFAEISQNLILAYFFFGVGLLSMVAGLLAILSRGARTAPEAIGPALAIAGGCGLMALYQIMVRRSERAAQSWRCSGPKEK